MKKITFSILLFASLATFAQVTKEDLDKEIKPLTLKVSTLQSDNSKLKIEVGNLNAKLKSSNDTIEHLIQKVQENTSAITQTANELGIKIKETGDKNEVKITEVSESLSKNSLYGIIGVLSAILLSGLLYWLLSKRQKSDKSDFIDQLSKTKSSIEESLVKEFGKQTDLMEAHLKIIEQQKNAIPTNSNVEPDHSLALKVADQVTLIERSINLMDDKTKGLQRIRNSITTLKDNLAANGYEMPEILGKQFHQGMKVIVASSIPDENLKKGDEIITKIIKPQVNYNDKMIQAAQIEVSVGY
jgi:hypothetical protein